MNDSARQSRSYRKARTEINRLRRLYATSMFSFSELSSTLANKIRLKELNPHEPIQSTIGTAEAEVLEANAFALMHHLKRQFPRYLRETIFVRLISALEVFLMDVIRDVFLARRELFHSDATIAYSQRELLSLKSIADIYNRLILRETRNLQNQGFEKVVKYYRSRFGIVLTDGNAPESYFEELHDRRHLLVHRLGETDAAYRHRYNSKEKRVTIDEGYLQEAFISIDKLTERVAKQAVTLTSNDLVENVKVVECEAFIEAEIILKACEELFEPSYVYNCGTGIVLLRDVILSSEKAGSLVSMKVGGTKEQIRSYISILKALHKSGALNLIHAKKNNLAKSKLSDSQLVNIAKILPDLPWDADCHKRIAEKIGISNHQAYLALKRIKSEQKYRDLIGRNCSRPKLLSHEEGEANISLNSE